MDARELKKQVDKGVQEALASLDWVALLRERLSIGVETEPASLSPGVFGTEVHIGLKIDGLTVSGETLFIPAPPAQVKKEKV